MIVATVFAALTVVGALQIVAGWIATVYFARRGFPPLVGTSPITILKPLHGDEPMLQTALTTLFEQDYPPGFQIVFGVHDGADTAIPVIRALQARYPDRDAVLVIDPTLHGANPKIGNLINMFPSARHDVIVIADSDVHAQSDYLTRLAASLDQAGVGLVTVLYLGLPAFHSVIGRLGATQITHGFLPGALLGRALGRRDCLGATMCLRRETLTRIGGLESLVDHLADDNVLGRRVRAEGLDVALAGTVVATTVAERSIEELWRHELRWARTVRSLEPAAFAASVLQYPLFMAILTIIASGFAIWSWVFALAVWTVRGLAVTGINRALGKLSRGLALGCPVWLLPPRDLLSVAEWAASHAGRHVDWRGKRLEADTPPRFT